MNDKELSRGQVQGRVQRGRDGELRGRFEGRAVAFEEIGRPQPKGCPEPKQRAARQPRTPAAAVKLEVLLINSPGWMKEFTTRSTDTTPHPAKFLRRGEWQDPPLAQFPEATR